jgi:hypothetical protein
MLALGRPRLSAARVKLASSATRANACIASSRFTILPRGSLFISGEQTNQVSLIYPDHADQ